MIDARQATRPKIASAPQIGTTAPSMSMTAPQPISTEQVGDTSTPLPSVAAGAPTPSTLDEYLDETIAAHRAFVHEKGITDEIIFAFLDTLVAGNAVLWQFELFGKIPVTFRVRPQWVDKYLVERLEKIQPSNVARYTDVVGTINLAGALETYDTTKFKLEDKSDLEATISFLGQLPFVIQNKLVNELAVFDRVVIVATSDWAVKNFTGPR